MPLRHLGRSVAFYLGQARVSCHGSSSTLQRGAGQRSCAHSKKLIPSSSLTERCSWPTTIQGRSRSCSVTVKEYSARTYVRTRSIFQNRNRLAQRSAGWHRPAQPDPRLARYLLGTENSIAGLTGRRQGAVDLQHYENRVEDQPPRIVGSEPLSFTGGGVLLPVG